MTLMVIILTMIAVIAGIWFVIYRLDERDRKIERGEWPGYWGEG